MIAAVASARRLARRRHAPARSTERQRSQATRPGHRRRKPHRPQSPCRELSTRRCRAVSKHPGHVRSPPTGRKHRRHGAWQQARESGPVGSGTTTRRPSMTWSVTPAPACWRSDEQFPLAGSAQDTRDKRTGTPRAPHVRSADRNQTRANSAATPAPQRGTTGTTVPRLRVRIGSDIGGAHRRHPARVDQSGESAGGARTSRASGSRARGGVWRVEAQARRSPARGIARTVPADALADTTAPTDGWGDERTHSAEATTRGKHSHAPTDRTSSHTALTTPGNRATPRVRAPAYPRPAP
jgi:hypothetical protein